MIFRTLPMLFALVLTLGAGRADALSLPKFGAAKSQIATASAPAWPQDASDLKPDPAVRFCRLPNGMRYAIMRNTTPTNTVALRLRFDAGSLDEAESERGLAHFIEHMAFNGSARVREGEMIKILQRHGLAFGADTNASTSWDETIYQLDLPRPDDDTLATGLMLMRETAGNLTFDPGAINRERGVVLSEERTRDGPGMRVYQAGLSFFLKGQLAAERMPIGKVEVLKTAGREAMLGLYHRYYRPERAVLVVVGDIDPDAIEARIKAAFSDWTGVGQPGPEPVLGQPVRRGLDAKVVVESGAPLTLQIAWARPYDTTRDSRRARLREMTRELAMQVLNRRLDKLTRDASPPFIGAFAGVEPRYQSAELTLMGASAEGAEWRPALEALIREQRRLVQGGVRPDELAREITEIREGMRSVAAQAASRRSESLANAIVDSVGEESVFTSPAEELAEFDQMSAAIDARKVSEAARQLFTGEGPLLLLTSPVAVEGGEAALRDAHARAATEKTAAVKGDADRVWPHSEFGPPGAIAGQTDVADLGLIRVRFANGVTLTVKPTKFRNDQVLVRVRFGNGLLDLPRDKQTLLWASQAFIEGGLKDMTAQEIEQALASKIVGAGFGVDDDAFVLSGGTRPADLVTEMQLITAYLSAPGLRPEAFRRVRTYATTLHDQLEATPQGVVGRDLPGLVHSGDARFLYPSRDQISQAKPEEFAAMLAPILSSGPIDVTVVGDIDAAAAIAAVQATLGALPPRQTQSPLPGSGTTTLPPPTGDRPVNLVHAGRADQAIGYVAWPAPDFFADPILARTLRLLAEIMENRLVEDLRESRGETYSPSVSAVSSLTFPNFGYVGAAVEIAPSGLTDFFASTSRIAHELAVSPVSADELERARKPMLEGLAKARQTNEYWLGQISGSIDNPRRLDALRTVQAAIAGVTPADIQQAARTYLRPEAAWKLTVTPAPAQ